MDLYLGIKKCKGDAQETREPVSNDHRGGEWRAIPVALLLLCAFPLWAADDFRTAEYKHNAAALDSINASKAYALGFSGKGVGVAIIDSNGKLGGHEFAGRVDAGGGWIAQPSELSFHGYAVAGVIGAAKDDIGMHGVAYQSNLMPLGTSFSSATLVGAQLTVLDRPDIKIVNNSWGYSIFNDTVMTFDADRQAELLYGVINNNYVIGEEMAKQGQLSIFAAGNEGHLTPSIISGLPTLLDAYGIENPIADNWLNVAAYDATQSPSSAAFIAPFSNLGQGAAEYTLLAPGVDIVTSTDAEYYSVMSGTSFSAPYVSGVAALTAQAFPYMNGKQLADVLLSTATPLIGDNQPRALFLIRRNYDPYQNYLNSELKVYATSKTVSFTEAEMAIFLTRVREDPFFDNLSDAQVRAAIMAQAGGRNITVLSEDEYRSLFGQGIVNAYKAVQGPGALNARRLTDSDVGGGASGGAYALYGIDTRGVDSVWSNDITQIRNQNPRSALFERNVGLRKQGGGTLYLTGNNTYAGPTIVQGGKVVVGNVAGGRGSLAGDVWVHAAATLGGHGKIAGSVMLDRGATLSPGASIGRLTVGEVNFQQGSVYEFEVDAQGQADSLMVTRDAHLAGTVALKNAYRQAFGERFPLLNVGGKLTGAFDALLPTRQTLFLTDTLSYSDRQAYLEVVRNNRKFSDVAQSGNQNAVARAIESQKHGRVFAAIANTASGASARYAFDHLNGEIYAASRSALLQRSRYLRDAVNSPMHEGKADALWLSTWANDGLVDRQPGFARVTHSGYGFLIGNGNAIGEASTLGFAIGSEKSKIKIDERAADMDVSAYHLAGYWGSVLGNVDVRAGLAYSYLDMRSERSINVPGLESRARANYQAHLAQGFVEGSRRFALNRAVSLEPYVNAAYVWLGMSDAREKGGAAALRWDKQSGDAAFSTLGLRNEMRIASPLPAAFYADAGYRRRIMTDDSPTRLRFARGDAFTVRAGDNDRDTLLLRAGISLDLTPGGKLSLGYQGARGKHSRDDSVRMQFGMAF